MRWRTYSVTFRCVFFWAEGNLFAQASGDPHCLFHVSQVTNQEVQVISFQTRLRGLTGLVLSLLPEAKSAD